MLDVPNLLVLLKSKFNRRLQKLLGFSPIIVENFEKMDIELEVDLVGNVTIPVTSVPT